MLFHSVSSGNSTREGRKAVIVYIKSDVGSIS